MVLGVTNGSFQVASMVSSCTGSVAGEICATAVIEL